MPVQQDVAKSPIPRIIHEYRLQKRSECRDDDGQWLVTEAGDGRTPVWFYNGKERLKPPGSQNWSNKPYPRSRQDKERYAKQAFPDLTEPDHPETIIGQLKAGYEASKNKAIERWIKDVERCREEGQGDTGDVGTVPSEKHLGRVSVTSNLFRTFPKRLDASQAYRTVEARQKRPASQTLLPSKRIHLGRGTLEDPVVID